MYTCRKTIALHEAKYPQSLDRLKVTAKKKFLEKKHQTNIMPQMAVVLILLKNKHP